MACGLQLLCQAFKRHARTLGELCLSRLRLAVFGNISRPFAISNGDELIASLGQTFKSEDLDRGGWRRSFHGRTTVVEHGANFSEDIADHEIIARVQGTVLHQNRSDGTATAIELGLQHRAGCRTIGNCLQVLQIGNEADHFQQQIEIRFLLSGNVYKHGITTPVFGH